MIRPLLAATAVLLIAATALADIGPKPSTRGATPLPAGKDMPGIEVEMAAEQVDLLLRAEGEDQFRLDVRAEFSMKNHGDDAAFETGFPIGQFLNFERFAATIDGEPVKAEIRDLGSGGSHAWWYVWPGRYRGHATSTHVVTYTVKMHRRPVSPNYAGYVLSTGAPWKGPIGKAVVTLRAGKGVKLEEVFRADPNEGGRRENDRIVWSFTDLEPTRDHDITFYFSEKLLSDDIAEARAEAERTWDGRCRLANHLRRLPDYWLRERMTDEELTAYLDALGSLIEGMKVVKDRVVLPRTDAGGDRPYVRSPENLLSYVRIAANVVEAYPESERARELLGSFALLAMSFLEGHLYAGDAKLELPWVGKTDTEAQRAFRDKAFAKRRAKIEENLARATKLLGEPDSD